MRTSGNNLDGYNKFCVVFDISKVYPDLGQDAYIPIADTSGIQSIFKHSNNVKYNEMRDEKMEPGSERFCGGEKSDIQLLFRPVLMEEIMDLNQALIHVKYNVRMRTPVQENKIYLSHNLL